MRTESSSPSARPSFIRPGQEWQYGVPTQVISGDSEHFRTASAASPRLPLNCLGDPLFVSLQPPVSV